MMRRSGNRYRGFISGLWLALFLTLWSGVARAQCYSALEIVSSPEMEKLTSPLAEAMTDDFPHLPNGPSPYSLTSLGGSRTLVLYTDSNRQSVGASYLAGDKQFHAIFLNTHGLYNLGTLGGDYSIARFINSSGTIVGESTTSGNKELHAFLYRNGQMYDLNRFVKTRGWIIEEVVGLEDDERITVFGRYGGIRRAAILQPIEQPVTHMSPQAGILGALALGAGAAFLTKETYLNPIGLSFNTRQIPSINPSLSSDGDSLSTTLPKHFPPLLLPGERNPQLATVPEPGILVFTGVFVGALLLPGIYRQVYGLRRPMD
jgi:probable HAF family extracellular repeat protein